MRREKREKRERLDPNMRPPPTLPLEPLESKLAQACYSVNKRRLVIFGVYVALQTM